VKIQLFPFFFALFFIFWICWFQVWKNDLRTSRLFLFKLITGGEWGGIPLAASITRLYSGGASAASKAAKFSCSLSKFDVNKFLELFFLLLFSSLDEIEFSVTGEKISCALLASDFECEKLRDPLPICWSLKFCWKWLSEAKLKTRSEASRQKFLNS